VVRVTKFAVWLALAIQIVCAGCGFGLVLAPTTVHAQSAEAETVRFTILHLNDVYEITPLGGEGGMARVAALKKRLQKNNPNTIMMLAGDLFSPSALGTARVEGERLAGKQIVAIMNAVGLDYMTFGNHEFDLNEEQFNKRMAESKFRWFSSNAMNAQGEPFPNVPTSRIIEFANPQGKTVKVGLFGLTVPSNPKPYVRYLDVWDEAKKQVRLLRPQVDVLIAMTHLDFEDDRKLTELCPQIDLIIGGHEHIQHRFEKGSLPPIFKADANARSAYLHYFAYDTAAKQLKRHSLLRHLDKSLPEDAAVKQEVARWVKIAFDGFRKDGFQPESPVVTTNIALDGTEESVRSKPTPLTIQIAMGMMDAAPGSELAIYNGGAIRIDDTLPAGLITEYDIIRILPFGGKVVLVEMSGELLQRVLDQGIKNRGQGGYLQTTGVRLNDTGTGWLRAEGPLDPSRTYKVAILDFLLTGREQNLEFLRADAPGMKVLSEGIDIRQATIAIFKKAFAPLK
jgi:5'-nucleotidase / UDP-sugar diphosphatase